MSTGTTSCFISMSGADNHFGCQLCYIWQKKFLESDFIQTVISPGQGPTTPLKNMAIDTFIISFVFL